MAETDILPHVIDQSPDINTLRHLVAFHPASDAILRLASLAVRSVPECESLRDKLRLSNHEFAALKAIATALPALPDTPESAAPQQLRALAYRHGHTHALDALRIKLAIHGKTMPDSVRTLIESVPDSCPFTGAMLLATGLAPGQHIGKIITAAETEWIAQDFPSDPATRDTILANAVKQHA
jgi:poly(A) polymerase